MSRFREMSPKRRAAWGWILLVLFVLMCVMIAWSQWYAYHVNVPRYLASPLPSGAPAP
jgi:hypothetical protein